MKVLGIHNFYQSNAPSGEDIVFKNELELLKNNGIEISTYIKHNDEILSYGVLNKLKLAVNTTWSLETYSKVKSLIKKEKPDVCHFHNIWYLISPSAYYACKDADVPVVQTGHNFRMVCANGLFMRNGKLCEECLGKLSWRSVVYGCFRNSRLHSIPVALSGVIHKIQRSLTDKVDAYIALTKFGKNKFSECGVLAEKIFVKPNFLLNPPDPSFNHGNYAIFLGRISKEKGLDTLIDAFRILNSIKFNYLQLIIVGDGPLRNELELKVKYNEIHHIKFTGKKNFNECMRLLRNARFLVMPSVWYETFGLTIIEAFACGKPVITSRLGAMADTVEDFRTGLLFEAGNSADLASKIKWMFENEDACIEMGKNAREEFEAKYTAEKNYELLMDIYIKAIKLNNKGI